MKTGSLQCCNLMAHAASEQQTFYWPRYSLVYPTELPGQVESRVKTFHSMCAVFNKANIFALFYF